MAGEVIACTWPRNDIRRRFLFLFFQTKDSTIVVDSDSGDEAATTVEGSPLKVRDGTKYRC